MPTPEAGDDAQPLAPPPRSSAAGTVLATLAVVGALWVGQRFLIPLAAGLLLAMLLGPAVLRAGRTLRSPALATVLALALFVAALGMAAASFGGQLARVADRVPEMISLAAQQLTATDTSTPSVFTRAREALRELDRAASRWADVKADTTTTPGTARVRNANAGARPAGAGGGRGGGRGPRRRRAPRRSPTGPRSRCARPRSAARAC